MSTNILKEADRLIHGERVKTYGKPSKSFQEIAQAATLLCGKPITPTDVTLVLVAQKLIRRRTSPGNLDHVTDACGYLGILADLEQEETP